MPRTGTYTRAQANRRNVLLLSANGASVDAISRLTKLRRDYVSRIVGDAVDVTRRRLDRLAETYGSMLDDPDPTVRIRAADGLREVEADRVRLSEVQT